MTNTYNTGNPLGSTAPKDLYDNASNFDEAMNAPGPSWTDRFGNRRETFAGLETAFQNFLLQSGYSYLGDYAAGLTFTARNQYTVRSGIAYRPTATVALPFTTTGTWSSDSVNFVAFDSSAGKANSGVNSDITQLTGLTTPLTPAQGGTGLTGLIAPLMPVASGTDGATDLNTLVTPGWYGKLLGGAPGARNPNHPYGSSTIISSNYCYLQVLSYNNGNCTQIAYPYSSQNTAAPLMTRELYDSVNNLWSAWVAVSAAPNKSMQLAGLQLGTQTANVGSTTAQNLLKWANIEIDQFGDMIQLASGNPTGLMYISTPGIYEVKGQLYVSPPQNINSKCDVYLGLYSNAADGSSPLLIKVANEEIPPGQHPSVSLDTLLKVTAAGYYSFRWYFLDGASLTPTLAAQTDTTYIWCSIKTVN